MNQVERFLESIEFVHSVRAAYDKECADNPITPKTALRLERLQKAIDLQKGEAIL